MVSRSVSEKTQDQNVVSLHYFGSLLYTVTLTSIDINL